MCRLVRVGSIVAACLIGPSFVSAARPVDPDLIPEARGVLDYLESVYGKKTLAGMSNWGDAGGPVGWGPPSGWNPREAAHDGREHRSSRASRTALIFLHPLGGCQAT